MHRLQWRWILKCVPLLWTETLQINIPTNVPTGLLQSIPTTVFARQCNDNGVFTMNYQTSWLAKHQRTRNDNCVSHGVRDFTRVRIQQRCHDSCTSYDIPNGTAVAAATHDVIAKYFARHCSDSYQVNNACEFLEPKTERRRRDSCNCAWTPLET